MSDQVVTAFSNEDIVKIDGLINIWASNAMLLIFPYLALYVVKEQFKLPLPIGEINKVGVVLLIIVAPLLSLGLYSQAKSNVTSYIECSEQRTFTSRYSSRTYAISEDMCLTLVEESS
ncbi:hypothetical protein [Vibrio mexicanus]|uniref:hypothetical protein n=1 Tax=Vibrio mexicanus TaxID=1004326 RepID=UPI0012F9ED8F|nr:hypothetical protein [Vibrio mexicanus]